MVLCTLLSALSLGAHGAETFDTKIAAQKLAKAAIARTDSSVTYNGAYVAIDYPGGDVPAETGVCSDVVVRSFRALDIDLQELMHQDMASHFSAYPDRWGLKRPDSNIDHRRVPNLETLFSREAAGLAPEISEGIAVKSISVNASDRESSQFEPGDIVSWRLENGLPHIGIVSLRKVPDSDRYMIVHNIGRGTVEEDIGGGWRTIGHYRLESGRESE